jgi:membrane associated rhomboid family serine protease
MIPISDVVPTRTTPWVTRLLAAAIGIVFAGELLVPALDVSSAIRAANSPDALARWRWLPALAFLHAGVVQAATNALALWLFGGAVEDRVGHGRFAALFLAGLVAAAIGARWAMPLMTPLTGATGPIAAIVAAYLVLWPRSRILVLIPLPVVFDLVEIPAAIVPVFWILLQLVGVAHSRLSPTLAAEQMLWATLAGALVGIVAARTLPRRERMRMEWWDGTERTTSNVERRTPECPRTPRRGRRRA